MYFGSRSTPIRVMAPKRQSEVQIEVERLFRAIDSDGSGTLSPAEFDAVSESLIQVLGETSQDATTPATMILKGMTLRRI